MLSCDFWHTARPCLAANSKSQGSTRSADGRALLSLGLMVVNELTTVIQPVRKNLLDCAGIFRQQKRTLSCRASPFPRNLRSADSL